MRALFAQIEGLRGFVWTYQGDTGVSESAHWYNMDPLRWRHNRSSLRSTFSGQLLTYESLFPLDTNCCLIENQIKLSASTRGIMPPLPVIVSLHLHPCTKARSHLPTTPLLFHFHLCTTVPHISPKTAGNITKEKALNHKE